VVGVHFVGGWIGCLWIGFFATLQSGFKLAHEGVVYGGGGAQLVSQAEGAGVVTVWSFVVALVIGYIVKFTIGFRAKRDAEIDGIDVAEHAESAYDHLSVSGGGGGGGAFAQAGIGTGGAHAASSSKPVEPANAQVG
jgi:Amt family ammonium transporter